MLFSMRSDFAIAYFMFQAKLAFERLPIPKVYHPFVCGPDQATIKDLMERTKARISVPPLSVNKDEIVVSGEKDGVHQCVQTIMTIYNEKVRIRLLYFIINTVTVMFHNYDWQSLMAKWLEQASQ